MSKLEFNFQNQTVWVTGAGSGIGKQIALDFVQQGAKVVGIDKFFTAQDYAFDCVAADLADVEQVQQLCQTLLAKNPRVDVLVNAAGVLRSGGLEQLTAADWRQCFASNVDAVFYLVQQLAPVFKQQRCGAIVTVASNAAHVPRLQMTAYCASKAAVVSLNNCIGLELAEYGVRANLVSPGSTDTPMLRNMLPTADMAERLVQGMPQQYKLGIPLKKIATPQDIANAVLFLASDLAGHITMQDIVIDGGATLAA